MTSLSDDVDYIHDLSDYMELGDIFIQTSGYTYGESDTRIRTRENTAIYLKKGDIISFSDYSNVVYYVGWKKSDGTYAMQGWLDRDYIITENADYVILFRYKEEKSISNPNELISLLKVKSNAIGNTDHRLKIIEGYINDTKEFLYKNSNIKSINHRGFNSIAPENTLAAYRLSKIKGFEYVETDVSFTSDSIPVLLHDSTVDRTSNGTGNINDLTYEQVKSLDFGSWKSEDYVGETIPSFKEFILLCRNLGLHPYIELKSTDSYTDSQIESCVNIVKECGMIRNVTWISFSKTFLEYVKQHDSKARLGFIVEGVSQDNLQEVMSLKNDSNDVFIDTSSISNDMVSQCVQNNIPVEVWTVNSESAILNLNSYVSGITSDVLNAGRIFLKNELVN